MVKAATKPKLTEKEEEYRQENVADVNKIVNKNLLCTSCNSSVKQQILKGKPRSHPFLETLLCEKCHTFFGDGDFSVDEDGSDKYCRWCGQGGTLYLCSKCTAGFCKKCIKRNLPRAILKEVEDDDWECLCCNVTPLYELRAHCWAALEYVKSKTKDKNEGTSKKRKTKQDSDLESEDDSSSRTAKKPKKDESARSKRSNRPDDEEEEDVEGDDDASPKKDEKEKKDNSKQFKVARAKISAVLQDLVKLNDVTKNKANDFKKKRVTAHKVNDLESFTAAAQSVTSMLQSVEEMTKKLRVTFTEYTAKFEESLNEKEKNGLKEDENGDTKQDDEEEKKTEAEEQKSDLDQDATAGQEQGDNTEIPNSPPKSPAEGEEKDGNKPDELEVETDKA